MQTPAKRIVSVPVELRKMAVSVFGARFLFILCLWVLLAQQAHSQDVEPRRWTPLPVGTRILGVGYAKTAGDIALDPLLQFEDGNTDIDTLAISYSRFFALGGKLARFDAIVPLQHANWSGLLDGSMQGGKANGFGIMYIAAESSGYDRFEGQFKNNEIDGRLSARTADGITFEGLMNSIDFSGSGILTTESGDQYTGELLNGKMNGKGHLVVANGEQYRGMFRDDELEGVGEWLGANGDYYKGNFKAGQFSGEGRYESSDGDLYEGEFADGLPNGKGRFTDADGRVTTGRFKAGWPEGRVDVTSADGKTISETWSDGAIKGGEQ